MTGLREWETHLGLRRLDRTAISMWVCSIYQELRNQACLVDLRAPGYPNILRPHGKQAHCYDKHSPSSAHQSVWKEKKEKELKMNTNWVDGRGF